MRIALVTDNLPSEGIGGGIGTYVVLVAEELARRGIETHIFRWRSPDPYLTYKTNDVTYHLCPRWVSAREDSLWQGAVCQVTARADMIRANTYILRVFLNRIAAKNPFDLIEFPDIDGYALSGKNLAGVKKVAVRLHGCSRLCRQFAGEPEDAPMTRLDKWEARAARQADVLTSVSHSALAATRKAWQLDLAQASVVPNPIMPLASQDNEPRDPATVFFSGRLERRKGVDTLAEAIPAILRAHPDAQVRIFGKDTPWADGQMGSNIIQEILRKHGICDERVRLMGAVPREVLLTYLRRATVAVVPSLYENQPFAVLEALACGTPLVVSDIPANREVVRTDHEGLSFPVGSAAELAKQINRLLANPAQRETVSQGALQRSQDFHLGPVVGQLLKAWGFNL